MSATALMVVINEVAEARCPPLSLFTSEAHSPIATGWSSSSSGAVCSNHDVKRTLHSEYSYSTVSFSIAVGQTMLSAYRGLDLRNTIFPCAVNCCIERTNTPIDSP